MLELREAIEDTELIFLQLLLRKLPCLQCHDTSLRYRYISELPELISIKHFLIVSFSNIND